MQTKKFDSIIVATRQVIGSSNPMVLNAALELLLEAFIELKQIVEEQAVGIAQLKAKVYGSTSEKSYRLSEALTPTAEIKTDDDGSIGEQALAPLPEDKQALTEALAKNDLEKKALQKEARKLERLSKVKRPAIESTAKPQVEIHRHLFPEDLIDLACPFCGEALTDQGKSYEAREIDLLESYIVERKHLLHKGACGCGSTEITMPAPVRGVSGTIYSPAFVANLLCNKFLLHLPLHRQVRALKDQGLKVSRSVLTNLVLRAHETLDPLVQLIADINRQQSYQQCDESPVLVVIEKEKQRRFLWCLLTKAAITFSLTKTRNKQVALDIIGSQSQGVLTTDCLSIYSALCPDKINSACMAHARRKFWESLLTHPLESIEILKLIADLYAVERKAPAGDGGAARLKLRQLESQPILDSVRAKLEVMSPSVKSPLGKAISYTLNHWTALTYFTKDGLVPIDNNATENALRAPKLGFNNYLFAQSEAGCDAIAGMYTLSATCGMYGVNFSEYLKDILTKLNRGHPAKRLAELTPWEWKNRCEQKNTEPIPKIKTITHDPQKIISLARVRAKLRKKA